jgi:hypothetical protein
MRIAFTRFFGGLLAIMLVVAAPLSAQQQPGSFRWIDFHSEKDQDMVTWVTSSLRSEKWTAIREIGVEYDAALVVTTLRAAPDSAANADIFTVWSVSLTNRTFMPLLKGVNLRWLDWMTFAEGASREPGIVYQDCGECEGTTFFTAFHYDYAQHTWAARWMRGSQAVPLRNNFNPSVSAPVQVYALLSEPNGRQLVSTWEHFDASPLQPAEDILYRYDLDPFSRLERTERLRGREAEVMKQRLCRAEDHSGLAHGQDSALCPQAPKPRLARQPMTTSPANTQGRSVPPRARH